MSLREYECPKCGLVKELLINSNTIIPKNIVNGCDKCREDLNYKISKLGYRRDHTLIRN